MSHFDRLIRPFVAVWVASTPIGVQAATISLSTPAAGQSYQTGAPIAYAGSGSWDINGSELQPSGVHVDLLWYDPQNLNGPGTIVESDGAVTTLAVHPNTGQLLGTFTFVNSTDGSGDSNLLAIPRLENNVPQSQTYKLRAHALDIKNRFYRDAQNNVIVAWRDLGTIS